MVPEEGANVGLSRMALHRNLALFPIPVSFCLPRAACVPLRPSSAQKQAWPAPRALHQALYTAQASTQRCVHSLENASKQKTSSRVGQADMQADRPGWTGRPGRQRQRT